MKIVSFRKLVFHIIIVSSRKLANELTYDLSLDVRNMFLISRTMSGT